MPFTVSHIAAVLPLQGGTRTGVGGRRGPLVASALAFGAMAPDAVLFVDFGFLPFTVGRFETHGMVPGVMMYDLGLTAVAVAVWHLLLLRPLLALLPDAVRARVEQPLLPRLPAALRAARREGRPVRGELLGALGWFTVSAWLGALTHIGWDAFTHHDDPGVAHVAPWLRDPSFLPDGRPWFSVLQYVGSGVGLVALAWWGARRCAALPAHPPAAPRLPVAARVVILGALTLAGVFGAIRTTRAYVGQPFDVVGFSVATGFGRWAAVALVMYAAVWSVWRARAGRVRVEG
ncbi:DUF4184 family protein [Yinghuangia sp. ASG 101]|uniref:DUF4184 family protein n=1 Tax=Yinghuangia sp. ASG 101 TaxID=2896848 RepID=UPI001E5CE09B|nr:DUF4184 family protein [Yinghuangia sp. ASG 101]UGQ09622.1 DUF4184 family protein [Yinghuangia sp. ASG 101]